MSHCQLGVFPGNKALHPTELETHLKAFSKPSTRILKLVISCQLDWNSGHNLIQTLRSPIDVIRLIP